MSTHARLVIITTVPQSLFFFSNHVAYAKAKGLDVHVLSSPGIYLQKFAECERVVPHGVQMDRRITPFRDLIATFKIWRLLRALRPTIVHATTPKGGLIGMIAAWMGRVPIRIYHLQGLPFMTATGPKGWLLRWTERVSCYLSHQVLCVCDSLRAVVISERICRGKKIKVLANGSIKGIDADSFRPLKSEEALSTRAALGIPPQEVVLGFVGRVVRDKGLVELAQAWRRLRESFDGMHLLIVGPFEPQDPLPSPTEQFLRTDPSIHLVGWAEDPRPLYAAMDLFVLPSYREGFGNVLLEAAAMELAVVATRIPGCLDAVQDGVTGTLVPPYDSEALAEAIRSYINDPELRMRHGLAGRARVLRAFRPGDIARALWEEYERLMGKTHV